MRYAYRENSKRPAQAGRQAEYHLGHLPPSQHSGSSGAAMLAGISRISHWLARWPDIRADTPAAARTRRLCGDAVQAQAWAAGAVLVVAPQV